MYHGLGITWNTAPADMWHNISNTTRASLSNERYITKYCLHHPYVSVGMLHFKYIQLRNIRDPFSYWIYHFLILIFANIRGYQGSKYLFTNFPTWVQQYCGKVLECWSFVKSHILQGGYQGMIHYGKLSIFFAKWKSMLN